MTICMTAEDLQTFLIRDFGQLADDFTVQSADTTGVVLKMRIQDRHLRPGGTVSGPSMFALADVAMYLAILAQIGPVALSVTTHCSIDFMRKPQAGRDLLGQARVLKLGRTLAVGDVMIFSQDNPDPVAHASLTYAIPPKGREAAIPSPP